ncbi:MAG: hormogonium polysaccharide biosynthesis glycosyltransferase HpsE [Microcoleaceae cyanobacterium]
MDFSVVIPTYNGAERLPDVIKKLQHQQGTEHLSWEIIVVDNNSSDQTAQVIQQAQVDWPYSLPLKSVFEARQGLAFARQCGVEAAQGEFVGFLDDDNWPNENWVLEAYKFGQDRPQAGAYGGKIHANYAINPPAGFERIEGFLAIRERGDQANLYQPEVLSLPPGASLVIRRQAWLDQVPTPPRLTRQLPDGSMIPGDDWEPLLYLHRAGWQIWYNPAMQIEHQIPPRRLERDYLLSLIHRSCLSFCPLKLMAAQPAKRPVILARTLLGNAYNASRYYLNNRTQLKEDTVAACEMQIYLSRIGSALYALKHGFYL